MYTERLNIRNSILRQDRDDIIAGIGTAPVRKRKRQTSIHQTCRRSVSVLAADVLILAGVIGTAAIKVPERRWHTY